MSKLYVQHDYQVTGKDYVETDGGDTPAGGIGFIDPANKIAEGTTAGGAAFEYTATDNCWITAYAPSVSGNGSIVFIDNIQIVPVIWIQSGAAGANVIIPVKAGQTVKVTNGSSTDAITYNVFGMIN